ncbi:MAG: hypothetical protein KDA32_02150 [Phycisphaerales bacterium]|nr:hypothetical protein [Phycisphaerales bacterium]
MSRLTAGLAIVLLCRFGPLAGADAPTIDAPPSSTTACAGAMLELSVVASGATAYQWARDDEPIPGATGDTLTIAAVQLADEGDYTVTVSNAEGSVVSVAAQVRVRAIVTQPAPIDACDPNVIRLSVEVSSATGSEVVDAIGSTASSATGSRLRGNYYRATRDTTLTSIESYVSANVGAALVFYVYEAETEDGDYGLVAQSSVTSPIAGAGWRSSGPLTVPIVNGRYYIIGAGWSSTTVTYYYGGAHPFSTRFGPSVQGFASSWRDPLPATAPRNTTSLVFRQRLTTSDDALSYEWRRDGGLLTETSDTLEIVAPASTDSGLYEVTIRAGGCEMVSDPTLVVVGVTPEFMGPIEQVGGSCRGETLKLFAPLVGSDLRYEWTRNDVIVGDTREYVVEAVSPADRGKYRVRIWNECGEAASDELKIDVADGRPVIVSQPESIGACAGKRAVLRVEAVGDELTYQWRRDGVDVAGATGDTLDLTPLEADDAGSYDVVISNTCGENQSHTVSVDVVPAPTFVDMPRSARVCPGADVALSADALDADSFQWFHNGVPITDATDAALRIDGVDANDEGEYVVLAAGMCGRRWSDTARIDLAAPVITEGPQDVYVEVGAPIELGVIASMFRQEVETIGDGSQAFSGSRMRGNLYRADAEATLSGFEQELSIDVAAPVRFFVYEGAAASGPFAVVFDAIITVEPRGRAFYGPADADVPLQAGKFYLIGAAWAGTHGYYAGGAHPQATWFGASVAGFAASYSATLPSAPTATQTLVWSQRLTTEDSSVTYQWFRNDNMITGATEATLSIDAARSADAGEYTVEVASSCGALARASAQVRVSDPIGAPTPPSGPRRDRRDH